MKVFSAIALSLKDNGIDTMFGLMGDANLYMADSFVRDQSGTFVSAAHESGAVLMALGYASVSGRIGVATVTHGPAVTNVVTALTEGVRAQLPMLLLCGDSPVEDRDHLQNIAQREVIVSTGAGFEQMRSPATATQDVATAIRRAFTERRPVALNMPIEFQWEDVEYRRVIPRIPDGRVVVPESADLDDAIGVIAAARRPIVVAGRGASSPAARSALLRLAERIDAPVATTLKARELFAGDARDLGLFGTFSTPSAVETILESDCVIFFGASLNRHTMSKGAFASKKRLVQVNAERTELGRLTAPQVGVVGDPALTADLFIRWLDEANIPSSGFHSSRAAAEPAQTLDASLIATAMSALDKALPADRLFVSDLGRFVVTPCKMIRVSEPRRFLMAMAFGSIGLGMGQAIGAAVAAPESPTLLVTGDGGFMLGGLTEFNTAVRHSLDLIVVVCNDGAYGAEHIQFCRRNMDPKHSLFDWPDLAPVAESLGGIGVTVRAAADLPAMVAALKKRDRPILIDLKLDPNEMPPLP